MTEPVAMPDLSFNPKAQISVRSMGREAMPLLVIDDVLLHPHQMVEFAGLHGQFRPPEPGSYYPGINGVLPPRYGADLVSALRPLLETIFAIDRRERLEYQGFFGLSTTPPEALQPLQTIPHFDSDIQRRLAMVHYFCDPPFMGTAFYRHTATGYESISSDRTAAYRAAVFAELDSPAEHGYLDGDTPHFTCIDRVDARFNRLVVYSTTSLHSGLLGGALLSADPLKGRLTANSFVEVYRPTQIL